MNDRHVNDHIFMIMDAITVYFYMNKRYRCVHLYVVTNRPPMNPQDALARKNLEKRLAGLRTSAPAMPGRGWIRAIRDALTMTVRQLAVRMHVAPSRIIAMEKAEASGAITLRTLRQAAEAMDCVLVYAFVPVKPLEDIVRDQAERRARIDLERVNHTMRLENQAVTASDLADEHKRLVNEWLAGERRGLWEQS